MSDHSNCFHSSVEYRMLYPHFDKNNLTTLNFRFVACMQQSRPSHFHDDAYTDRIDKCCRIGRCDNLSKQPQKRHYNLISTQNATKGAIITSQKTAALFVYSADLRAFRGLCVDSAGVEFFMQIMVRDNNVDQALRALKKKLQREGVYREMKLRRHFEKPSEKRAREKAAAVRRARKMERKQQERDGAK